jgi:hypothetical protein
MNTKVLAVIQVNAATRLKFRTEERRASPLIAI